MTDHDILLYSFLTTLAFVGIFLYKKALFVLSNYSDKIEIDIKESQKIKSDALRAFSQVNDEYNAIDSYIDQNLAKARSDAVIMVENGIKEIDALMEIKKKHHLHDINNMKKTLINDFRYDIISDIFNAIEEYISKNQIMDNKL